jgi:hypothetical protein
VDWWSVSCHGNASLEEHLVGPQGGKKRGLFLALKLGVECLLMFQNNTYLNISKLFIQIKIHLKFIITQKLHKSVSCSFQVIIIL